MNRSFNASRTIGSARRIHPALFAIGAIMLAGSASHADIYTVTNLADSGAGSLRQAITDANAHAGADSIVFSKGVVGTIGLKSALPTLAGTLTITGPGANTLAVSRVSTVGFRIFDTAGAAITITGLTLSGGVVRGLNGGGINNSGSLMMDSCILTGNSAIMLTYYNGNSMANWGFGPVYLWAVGGGLYNSGTAAISNCLFASNGSSQGGGFYNAGTATVTSTTINGNSAFPVLSSGGGICNTGSLMLIGSLVTANSAPKGHGGGAYNVGQNAILTLHNSSVIHNFVDDIVNSGGQVIYK